MKSLGCDAIVDPFFLLFLNLRLNKKFNEIRIAFRLDVLIYTEQIRRIVPAFDLNQPIVVSRLVALTQSSPPGLSSDPK